MRFKLALNVTMAIVLLGWSWCAEACDITCYAATGHCSSTSRQIDSDPSKQLLVTHHCVHVSNAGTAAKHADVLTSLYPRCGYRVSSLLPSLHASRLQFSARFTRDARSPRLSGAQWAIQATREVAAGGALTSDQLPSTHTTSDLRSVVLRI